MIREELAELIKAITPLDAIEEGVIVDALEWIASEEPMFREIPPDIPNKHWVSYALCLDLEKKKILLGHHVKSDLWLPSGGHVELWENPGQTALREFKEEIFVDAALFSEEPIFISSAPVVVKGHNKIHTDVSLWYLVTADAVDLSQFDRREFYALDWFAFDALPKELDLNMGRFMQKLSQLILEKSSCVS